MQRLMCFIIILFFSFLAASCSQRIITQPIPVNDLAHTEHYHSNVKRVIWTASELSKEHLGYRFGSDNPRTGAMDCSGVIYYLFKRIHPHAYVPRDSYEMYIWLLRAGKIHYVSDENFNSYQFNALKPGDLLFWTGTYRTNRKPPITHVMMYLGKNRDGQRLMFGSSDGGIYRGDEIDGVSVFDFILPTRYDYDRFVAYGCAPGFTC